MNKAFIVFLIVFSADNGIKAPVFLAVDGENIAIESGAVILEVGETRIILDVADEKINLPNLTDLSDQVLLRAVINGYQFDFGTINSKLLMFDQETALKFRVDNYPFENEFEFAEVNWDSLSRVQYLALDPSERGDGIELIQFVTR